MLDPHVTPSGPIYDIGSNNGDDLAYYLLKAENVVAVEPNPLLCDQIRSRYDNAISSGRLHVVNAALVDTELDVTDFYLNNKNHVLSSLSPDAKSLANYTKIQVRATHILDLVEKFGSPYYVKIDVEGFDLQVLRSFTASLVRPPYISAESHQLGVFAHLSEVMGYNSFKIVDGRSVPAVYRRLLFHSPVHRKMFAFSFSPHSAGPFGNDIFGEWMDKSTLLRVLALQGLGWKDIHASSVDAPTLRY